jgi:hypothetical protein
VLEILFGQGDIEKRKMVTVAWHKVCKPYDEGGLGIRSLTALNCASNLKFCWELHNSDEPWARILRAELLEEIKLLGTTFIPQFGAV